MPRPRTPRCAATLRPAGTFWPSRTLPRIFTILAERGTIPAFFSIEANNTGRLGTGRRYRQGSGRDFAAERVIEAALWQTSRHRGLTAFKTGLGNVVTRAGLLALGPLPAVLCVFPSHDHGQRACVA